MKSLRSQFFTLISILLVIVFALLNTIPVQSSRDAVFEEKRSALTGQGVSAASALSRLDRLSADNIKEVLSLLEMSGYSRIVISDSEGGVIYDTLASEPLPSDISRALSGITVFRSSFTGDAFDSSYTTPLSSQKALTGVLYIRELDNERAKIIADLENRILLVSLIVCLLTIVVVAVFSMGLINRISRLSDSMKVVAAGDYGYRHTAAGEDEIAELGREFNILTEKLEATEQQRRRFVSDASHELKTPLSSIRLLSDSIIQNSNMDIGTVREFVSDINNEAGRLQHTAESLLSLSRLDDDVKVAEVPVDMKQSCLDVLVTLRPLAAERSVKIRCELEDGCVVMATTDDIYHIAFNLIENAVKYNSPGGSVEVQLSKTDDRIELRIKDTGIGIPESERLNVFTRFYRIDKARSRESGGSGLGLSIVHDAVKAHRGEITIGENRPKGCIFTVSFPTPPEEETGI